ncbi:MULTISPECIES: hydantoinase B/oxoprolinase family protein [unclassified Phenylobacterium]|uniref:hydantoinase B/oxoprolinase family protein n=1 Tax=unclassified Phenylobacterium TaxID=2640670 RepID=UPI00083B2EF9|nr:MULTISPECIES: hydantoinase B/oxoprolinase family protein [unclassified Phenylobacterium]
MSTEIDPITLEIWWSRLVAIADESAKTLLRSAFSTIIRESNDFATCLLNARGETLAECSGGIPTFAGLLGRTTRHFLETYPADSWREGDCVITNDPWIATGHLPDIAVVMPIFHHGRLVGFSGTVAHSPDIGGSLSGQNRDLIDEGVVIPPVRLYRAGERNEELLKLLLANIRMPKLTGGDLEAQVSANEVCRRRAVEFLEDTGLTDFEGLSRAVHQKSEQAMRQAIAAIPDGVYRSEIDADGFDDHPTHIACTITVSGDTMKIDYAGTALQNSRATNCTLNYTQAYSIYPIKCVLDPLTRRNEGSYRPIEVTAPEGTLVNCRRGAAVQARHLTGHLLSCAIYQALADVVPERVIADSGGAPAMRIRFYGQDDEGRRFGLMLFASAGMGAGRDRDGLSTTAFPTNSGAGSIEALEATSPLLFRRKEFRPDSGGPGRHRGGLGQEVEVENLSNGPVEVQIIGDRERHPALGIHGGGPGAPAAAVLDDGKPLRLKSRSLLEVGRSVTLQFAGGGGYGPPPERDPAALASDIENGFVTPRAASQEYAPVDGAWKRSA